MLADDNHVERAYLSRFLTTYFAHDFTLVGEARDGREVLELSQESMADLYLLDIQMPKLTGLEVAEHLKRRNSEVAILFITSYADFAYVRKALQLGVIDYLLKPYDDAELQQTIQAILSKLDKHFVLPSKEVDTDQVERSLLQTRFLLSKILFDQEMWHSLDQLLTHQRARLQACKAVILYPCPNNQNNAQLTSVLKGIFCKRELHALLLFRKEEIILFLFGDRVRDFQDLESSIQRSRTFFQDEEGNSVFCAVSSFASDEHSLLSLYTEVSSFLLQFAPPSLVQHYQTHLTEQGERHALEKRMTHALLTRKQQEFAQLLAEYLDHDAQMDTLTYLLYLFTRSVGEILGRTEEEHNQYFLQAYEKLSQRSKGEAALPFLLDIAQSIAKDLGEGGSYHNVHLVRNAIRIITKGCRNKITLQDIADELEVSYSHLSKCFKQVTGTSFNAFLLETRMQEAVKLLETTNLSIAEVGKQVGIDDPYYFSKSFKKFAKMSPREFVAMHTISRSNS
jgi:two-component system response regulator YesN